MLNFGIPTKNGVSLYKLLKAKSITMWSDYQYIKINNKEVILHPLDKDSLLLALGQVDGADDIVAFFEQWVSLNDFVEIKTSGSTGTPKVIRAKKEFMVQSALQTNSFFQLDNQSTALLCLSANYIAGQMMIVRAIVAQMNLIVVSPKGNITQKLSCNIDFAAMVPNQVLNCLKTPQYLNKIKTLIIGGGKVDIRLVEKLHNLSTNCYETFGMTETLSHIALKQLSVSDTPFITLGGVTVAQSGRGTLVVNYPALGICAMETNDIVDVVSCNSFVWKGRTDFVINSGGIKISPEEIEMQIGKILPNMHFCISSLPDEKLGNKLVMVVETSTVNESELLQILKTELKPYYVPKAIVGIDVLPTNCNGKLDRLAVKDWLIKSKIRTGQTI